MQSSSGYVQSDFGSDDDDERLRSVNNDGNSNDNKNDNVKICGFEDLIPFVNMLQSVFLVNSDLKDVVKLPQLVIVGSQSAGKTSLLENLVQQNFLPKGEGLATNRPILLKLTNTSNTSSQELWCEFGHIKDKKFLNFREVEAVIQKLTNEVGAGISDEVIELSIYSPNVVTLTIVDLPGLTQVPKAGQPVDTPDKIRELVAKYITPKDSLILAVSAANEDFENSASIRLAREVDPNGDRTLAVLTKLDLAKKTKNILTLTDMLQSRVISVKLGVIGVINRSSADIKRGKSFTDVLADEKKFLMQNFQLIASKHGTEYLAHYLNRLLLTHIEACLPEIETNLRQQLTISTQELSDMGEPVNLSSAGKRSQMIAITTDFADRYKAQIDGRSRKIDLTVVCGGARIDHIFNVIFINELKKATPLISVSDIDIIEAIRNSVQIESRLSVPEDAFKELVKKQIVKMRSPVMDCARLVYEEMIKMVPQCIDATAKRFPKVVRQITQILAEMLYKNYGNSITSLEQYMNIQSASAITAEENFYKSMERDVQQLKVIHIGKLPVNLLDDSGKRNEDSISTSVENVVNGKHGETDDDNDDEDGETDDDDEHGDDNDDDIGEFVEANVPVNAHSTFKGGLTNSNQPDESLSAEQLAVCNVTRKLMDKFLCIVINQIKDYVPKSLLYTLVYATIDSVNQELTLRLITEEKIESLMMESEKVIIKRETISRKLQVVEEACKQLEKIQENCVF